MVNLLQRMKMGLQKRTKKWQQYHQRQFIPEFLALRTVILSLSKYDIASSQIRATLTVSALLIY
jgi:hypothetical protein